MSLALDNLLYTALCDAGAGLGWPVRFVAATCIIKQK